jgi:Asp-tRNA(Asn)/Glu-tRNA(Gln) amidotransferase A subunit family amidase
LIAIVARSDSFSRGTNNNQQARRVKAMARPNELTACAALALMRTGDLTALALTRACLERIADREPQVQAFAHLDPELALAQARRCDAAAVRGPLHGLPFGVKDLIDTVDLPTECGSPIHAGNRPGQDAACVALAREAGAVILGKTVTTEFALRHPGPTANPRNLGHTPGGSSSGSAAAVADCMVPVAFGTQTGGSVIRPASFCGIVGYKPTLGLINRTGVKPLADSFDTVGLFARSVADVAFVAAVLSGDEPAHRQAPAVVPARMGLCRTPYWDQATTPSRDALETAAERLRQEGVIVEEIALPAAFDGFNALQSTVLRFEAYRTFAWERTMHPEKFGPTSLEEFEAGSQITRRSYLDAKQKIRACRGMIAGLFEQVDLLLAPSAPGEAPAGLASTGDAVFNQIWTGLLTPCLNLPGLTGPNGLPVGVQTIGARNDDVRLLGWSAWIEPLLAA